MISESGETLDFGSSRLIVGAKQLRKAIAKGLARRVYLAQNADPMVTKPLLELCMKQNIPYVWIRSMADLGRACHIEVGAAAAAVVD